MQSLRRSVFFSCSQILLCYKITAKYERYTVNDKYCLFLTSFFLQFPHLYLEEFFHFLPAFLVCEDFSHPERSLKLI